MIPLQSIRLQTFEDSIYLWKITFWHNIWAPCLVVREVAEKHLNTKSVKEKEKGGKKEKKQWALAIQIYIDWKKKRQDMKSSSVEPMWEAMVVLIFGSCFTLHIPFYESNAIFHSKSLIFFITHSFSLFSLVYISEEGSVFLLFPSLGTQ